MLEKHREWLAPVLAALLGALFFTWIAGARVLTPTETTWSMQGDWRIHFLGWQFFRHEPWHLPPGRIDRYFVPLGSAVGLTDSIPIAAFAMKPFSQWLPPVFQYLGLWLCLCFALQGAFGAMLMRRWTSSLVQQVLGAACFILVPTLLMRTLHPALCAHWLLLWALWLYFRVDRAGGAPVVQTASLSLVAGLVHPYLAVMSLALSSALGGKLLITRHGSGLATMAAAFGATMAGWWLSGLFTVSSSGVVGAEGLRMYSMNLLAPITPTGWSTLLPEVPIGAEGQLWEGFQYLGAGMLLLMVAALIVRRRRPSPRLSATLWPLALATAVMAIYALSPRVTFGSAVVFEVTSGWIDQVSIFRATGRFFWPAAYLLLLMALAVVVSHARPRVATAVLCLVIVTQFVDLRGAHESRRQWWRSEQLFGWRLLLPSRIWEQVLPHYSHVVMFPPSYCAGEPSVNVESISYLAALHGLSLNAGLVARFDEAKRDAACQELVETLLRGDVDDTRLYVGRLGEIDRLKGVAKAPMVCGVIDGVGVCATARSYDAWRDVVHLE